MTGHAKNCVLTGGTSGIGKAAALLLARRGASVVVVGRDRARGEAAVAEMRERSDNERVHLEVADLSAQRSVRDLAAAIIRRFPQLHVLVHNAGVVEPGFRSTEDGIEATLAVNHLASFLLTSLLLPSLKAGAPSRIVTVTSQSHADTIDVSDLQLARHYRGAEAYRRSKLANVLFTRELARRLQGSGVTANCLHPGVTRTRLLERYSHARRLERRVPPASAKLAGGALLHRVRWLVDRLRPRFFRGRPEAADAAAERVVYLATSEDVAGRTGEYYVDNERSDPVRIANDAVVAKALWDESAKLVGL